MMFVSSAFSLTITPITEPGLFFDHLGTLLIERGAWETTFHTKIFPKNDTDILTQIKYDLNEALNPINETDTKVQKLRESLIDECNYAINLVKEATKFRVKRSGGVFGVLKDFIFGGNEIDEQLSLLKSTEDLKISKISDKLDDANSNHKKIMEQMSAKVAMIDEGAAKLRKDWNESKRNIFNKHIQETIMLGNTLVQQIINKYQTLRVDPLSHFNELETILDIRLKSNNDVTIEAPILRKKELIAGEVILHIEHIVISKDQFEIFDIIPIPDFTNGTILNIEETRVAVNNDQSYVYPHEMKPINTTHYLSSKTIIRKETDCIVAALLHISIPTICSISHIKLPLTKFYMLNQPNQILYYSAQPQEIFLNCNGTLTNPAYNTGIITLSPACKLETRSMEIRPVVVKKNEIFKTYFKPMKELPFKTAVSKNVIYYMLIITTLALIPLTILAIFTIKRCNRRRQRPPPFKAPTEA